MYTGTAEYRFYCTSLINYRFSYAAFMAVQFVGAASYVPELTILEQILLFFVIFPILFTRINLLQVQVSHHLHLLIYRVTKPSSGMLG